MNTKETLISSRGHQRLGLILGTMLSLMLFSGSALASTAANHVIRNAATVNYDNAASVAQTAITVSTDVTVNLVPSSPTLSAPTDISTDSGTDADYAYTLTATANGLDTYNLSTSITAQTTVGSTAATSVASLALGATTTAVGVTLNAGSNTTITVPSDGAIDGAVNGLAVGDTVVIGGFTYDITAIDETNSDDPDLTSTSTITVDFDGNTPALAVGDVIGEQGTFTMSVTPGTGNGTVDVDTTATSATLGAATDTDDTITTVTAIVLTVTKYVANTTAAVVGGGSTITVDTGGGAGNITYYTSGVSGNPGDTLEYVIEVANGAASSPASDVRISDPIPAFTTYTASSMRLDPGTGTWAAGSDAVNDADAAETDATTVYIYVGTGGVDSGALGAGVGGSLAISTTTLGSFRVTIDN